MELLRHGGVGAVAAAGVAGAVGAAGVAAMGTDADPAAGADADPRVRAVAAAESASFQRISWSVRRRLASGPRLPNSIRLAFSNHFVPVVHCHSYALHGLSVTISCLSSKKSCLSSTQHKRSQWAARLSGSFEFTRCPFQLMLQALAEVLQVRVRSDLKTSQIWGSCGTMLLELDLSSNLSG